MNDGRDILGYLELGTWVPGLYVFSSPRNGASWFAFTYFVHRVFSLCLLKVELLCKFCNRTSSPQHPARTVKKSEVL